MKELHRLIIMMLNFLFCVILLLQTTYSVATQKQNQLGSKTTPCNINTYNSFYAGPNKKLEDIILGIKRQLDEMQKDLRNLTRKQENNTKGKYNYFPYYLSYTPTEGCHGNSQLKSRK